MLISKVPDEEGSTGEGCDLTVDNDAHEYQTASELFDFMATNQNFNTNDGDALTPRDLILLYKNIDLGTKLMTNAKEFQCVKSNQHVETVVYNDGQDFDDSDISDIYSNEDLRNVFLINKERLDLFSNQSSVQNTLCHKFGDLEIQASTNSEYNRQFLFNDPFIKDQLKNFDMFTTNQIATTVLPTSLLDYVCCKRLEDNYNFYMDNIIRYVQNTIEHLKRISNGDYLTDRAKEKWREVKHTEETMDNNTKVLATSTSIPLHVECKIGGALSTWDDIVHSAVDIRSLSKILEKKIVVEIPKLISGSYKLFSKCCRDNLIISCQKDKETVDKSEESRVDVVFQLNRSETGHVMSNINSIMILQTVPILQNSPLLLKYKEKEYDYDSKNDHRSNVNITELCTTVIDDACAAKASSDVTTFDEATDSNKSDSFIEEDNNKIFESFQENRNEYNSISNDSDDENQSDQKNTLYDICPDNLQAVIHNMSLSQSVLTEESLEDVSLLPPPRKTSPKVRIKSPYENQSYIMEEKKRKKLLEIRQRRERKKLSLVENSKLNKQKYGKLAAMPQPSNSVTKLSITNKSFYNSIYGQNGNVLQKQLKNRSRSTSGAKSEMLKVALENLESEQEEATLSQENDSKKFINRSYYLDDTVTEMMFVNMKQEEEEEDKGTCSASNSSDYRVNLNILSQLIASSESELNVNNEQPDENVCCDETPAKLLNNINDCEASPGNKTKELPTAENAVNVVPSNTPNVTTSSKVDDNKELNNLTPSIECRKSIDKIYQLIKKLGNPKASDDEVKCNGSNIIEAGRGSSSIQASDSGTSLKHHLTSSNPSTFSFDKINNTEASPHNDKPAENPTNVIPKVIISSKSQIPKTETEHFKRERKRLVSSPKVQENPLKAISQLLHEFENVQKNRIKSDRQQKSVKRTDATVTFNEGKTVPCGNYKRQLEPQTDSMNRYNRTLIPSKDRKIRQLHLGTDAMKNSYKQNPTEERYLDKNKKKISDVLDEVKEAKGEAVRGPSKLNSRLNTLAQPKRIYVQAHSEDYQNKYGRNLITDRLQRLAASPVLSVVNRTIGSPITRNKTKRSTNEPVPIKFQPAGLPIERQPLKPRYQRSHSSSPDRKEKIHPGLGSSNKAVNISETPEIKKKTVAFEPFVNQQYKPTSFSTIPSGFQYAQQTRTPLLPNDIDIGSVTSSSLSAKESADVGNKLHHIINAIVKPPLSGLEILDECFETNSKSNKDDSIKISYEDISLDSDYTTGTTENEEIEHALHNMEPLKTVTGVEKENALCGTLSVGAFGKRMKDNSLSQKSSIYFLQTSDIGSIMIKASISQSLKTDKLLDLQVIPTVHKPNLKWSFTNIPLQITTVGYAFPEYSLRCGSPSLCNLLADNTSPTELKSSLEKSSILCNSLTNISLHQEYPRRKSQNLTPLDEFVQVDASNFAKITKESNVDTCEIELETVNNKLQVIRSDNVTDVNKDIRSIVNVEDKNEKVDRPKSNDSIDYSTSLDILMGLLNEIKNITCESQLMNKDHEESKELETILNKTFTENSIQSSPFDDISVNELSITSLDKLRGLESNPSVYSYFLSDNQRIGNYGDVLPDIRPWYDTRNAFYRPICADKEVNADIIKKDYVNKLIDVPSIYFPIAINHSTNVTNSIIGSFQQSSTQSLVSFYSTDLNDTKSTEFEVPRTSEIIDLPNTSTKKEFNQILDSTKMNPRSKKTNKLNPLKQNRINKNQMHKKLNEICSKDSDFDSVMKMKRDILVTVYSMLVLTVFAALSFPEVLYHV